MKKTLVFDMDGTIADFYSVDGWLEMIKAEDETPYVTAKPIYDMDILTEILKTLQGIGWEIVITSWLAKGSSKEYDVKVEKAKRDWLTRYNFPADEINIVEYGMLKDKCTEARGGFQVLVDDNEEIRRSWKLGATIDATENIMKKLVDLLILEVV